MQWKKILVASLLLLAASAAVAANPRVQVETSLGNFTLELYPEAAPATVENFLNYVKAGFYAGTTFHRVIKGFMIQGGGYTRNFQEKMTRAAIKNEASKSHRFGIKNETGTIAMARGMDSDSAASQFFINLGDNVDTLDWGAAPGPGYCAFGKIVDGMETVQAIAETPTGAGGPFLKDVPIKPVVIFKTSVLPES